MRKRQEGSLVILAGGRSSRMGQDKADLLLDGKTFLQIQIDKGVSLGIEDILVSGYHGRECARPVIMDRFPGKGPLAGMEACLRKAKGQFCLVLSVDVPLVPAEELKNLVREYLKSEKKAVIMKAGDRQHPLIGVYDVSLADEMMVEFLERKGSVFAFLNRISYDVYESKMDPACCVNINDRDTYHQSVLVTG